MQAHSASDRSVGYLLRLMGRSVGHRLIPLVFIRLFHRVCFRKPLFSLSNAYALGPGPSGFPRALVSRKHIRQRLRAGAAGGGK
jgi:hypothetical protein